MKYIIICLIGLFIVSCSNESDEYGWNRDKLKGKVKSFSEFSYKAKERFGKIEKGKREREREYWKDYQNRYNERGNKIEEKEYNSNGSLYSKGISKYDEQGN